MPQRFTSVSGFVLAGGASRRMGEDKSKLVLEGEAMLERQLRLLRSVCRFVAVLGPAGSHSGLGVSVFPDELGRHGPLGGLYTALGHTRTEFNLVLACDLPFLETGFLRYLCRRALDSQADVTVPESRRGRFEPLCAVYRRRALEAVRRSIESGENKVTRFFSQVRTEVIPWRDLSRAGFSRRIFDNMNTPQDYEAAKKVIRTQ